MNFKDSVSLKRKSLIFTSLILFMVILGSLFGLSLAYNKGSFSYTQESYNPYLLPKIYYNETLISDGITGTISNEGEVSITIGENIISPVANTLALPLTIKNAGNINGSLSQLLISIEFYDGETLTSLDNAIDSSSYYFTFNANTGYSLILNSIFSFSDINLTSNEGNSSQFLTSITINSAITTSDLLGKNFVINVMAFVEQ